MRRPRPPSVAGERLVRRDCGAVPGRQAAASTPAASERRPALARAAQLHALFGGEDTASASAWALSISANTVSTSSR